MARIQDDLRIVPGERMKGGLTHRVPLSQDASAVLEQVRGRGDDLIFPSAKRGAKGVERPQSDMVFKALVTRMKRDGFTTHGFRSTFRDWGSGATDFSDDLAEHRLAHRVGSAVGRAYARSDRLGKRRTLLESWKAHHLSGREGAVPEGGVAACSAARCST